MIRRATVGVFGALLAMGLLVVTAAPGEARGRARCGMSFMAHRGAEDRHHTENTIRTFDRAYHLGMRSLETDIRLTADDQWVLMHDPTVDRTTNGVGAVSTLSLAQIRALRTNDGITGGVPALNQALWFIQHRPGAHLQIEVKTYGVDSATLGQIVTLAQHYGVEDRISVTSYSIDTLLRLRQQAPGIQTGLVTRRQLSSAVISSVGGVVLVEFHSVSRWYVELLHAAHIRVDAWTVDRARSLRRVKRAGVDTVITDSPPAMRRLCGRR